MQLSPIDLSKPVATVRREGLIGRIRPDEPIWAVEKPVSKFDRGSATYVERRWSSLDDAIAGARELIKTSVGRPAYAVVRQGDQHFTAHELLQARWDDSLFGSKPPSEGQATWLDRLEPTSAVGVTPIKATMVHIAAKSAADKYSWADGTLDVATGNGVAAIVGPSWKIVDGQLARD